MQNPMRKTSTKAAFALVAIFALSAPVMAEQRENQTLTLDQLFPSTPFQGGARGQISGWRPTDPVPPDAASRRPAKAKRANDLARTGAPGVVAVTRLDGGNPDAAGLFSARTAGLPATLWTDATAEDLVPLLTTELRLPALRGLKRRLLLAQLDPPARQTMTEGGWLNARADALITSGEPGTALALLNAAGSPNRRTAGQIFDASLLTGADDTFCAALTAQPGLAPDLASRVWCLAQQNDWAAAALTLQGGIETGLIRPPLSDLLTSYLDDSSADETGDIAIEGDVTPLSFRLHEASGTPLPTQTLPLAYAVNDLGPNGGWLARIQAAERLARAGALAPADLARVYSEHDPAASGGAWDRAASWQRISAALDQGDGAALAAALPPAIERFSVGQLLPMLAFLIGPRLPEAPPQGDVAEAIVTLRLLAGLPVTAPKDAAPLLAFAAALARDPASAVIPPGYEDRLAPLREGLLSGAAPSQGKQGIALFNALADVDAGLNGDLARAARGLSSLDALGQQGTARQAAVELILLSLAQSRVQ